MDLGRIRIGILGLATIAKRSVIPALLDLKHEFEITGIATRNKLQAISFCDEVGVDCIEGYESLIRSGNIDAVYIPLPNSLHYEWVKMSLLNGLHVLVEKSLGCNPAEVKELCEIAASRNLSLIENFQFRFHGQLTEIKNIVDSGEIGAIRSFRSSFGFPPFPDENNIRYHKHLGGGALLDAGAYPVKIAQIFLGNDLEVKAASLFIDQEKEVDIWGGAFLKCKQSHVFAEIAFGFDNFYQCNIELWGSKGKIFTNRIFTAPPGFSPVLELEKNGESKRMINLNADNHFINMLKYFRNTIFNKEDRQKEYADNVLQSQLLNQILVKSNG